jgi:cell shape-determining protein MreC
MQKFLQTKRTTSSRSSNGARIRGVLLIALVVLLLVYAKGILSAIASVVTFPLYTVADYLRYSSGTVPSYLRDRTVLLEEKNALELELASQQGMATTLAHTLRENEELRALLNASSTGRIAAGVIARPPFTPYDTLVLDQGSESGIIAHAPVFHINGTAIGYVQSVSAHNALVTLLSAPSVRSTVYVFGPNLFAHAEGQGGGVVRISIPQGISVSLGDSVVLPSLNGGMLGTIDAVESTPTGPEQYAFVTLSTPLSSLRLVGVGTRPLEPVDFPEAQHAVAEAAQTLFIVPVPVDASMGTSTASTTDGLTL